MDKEEHKFNDNNVLRVRKDSKLNQCMFLSKLIMKKHGSVQLEGMGECISLVTKIMQLLVKDKLAEPSNIRSDNIHKQDTKAINPKLTVKLAKSAQFDNLTKDIELRN